MKTRVMIIEDNLYKSFTAKQVLEAQLKLTVKQIDVQTGQELMSVAAVLNPDIIMCCPEGGIAELLHKMKKRGSNRRNTEITLVLAQEFDDGMMRRFQGLMEQRRAAAA